MEKMKEDLGTMTSGDRGGVTTGELTSMLTVETALTKICGQNMCAGYMMRCRANECMFWRFLPRDGENKIEAIKRHRNDNGTSLEDAKNYVESHPEFIRRPASDRGYCGIAGKPEA